MRRETTGALAGGSSSPDEISITTEGDGLALAFDRCFVASCCAESVLWFESLLSAVPAPLLAFDGPAVTELCLPYGEGWLLPWLAIERAGGMVEAL